MTKSKNKTKSREKKFCKKGIICIVKINGNFLHKKSDTIDAKL